MQSFGLWYKKLEDINAHDKKETDASEQVEFSAHINFWFLEDISAIDNKNSIREPYIDIGLKIKNYKLDLQQNNVKYLKLMKDIYQELL